jgi:hypothetical protein
MNLPNNGPYALKADSPLVKFKAETLPFSRTAIHPLKDFQR